jgi:hypothetical protein
MIELGREALTVEALELRGRHLLEIKLDDVRAVSVIAERLRRRAPGVQRSGGALLSVEPRGVRVVDRRWRPRGAPLEGKREHVLECPAPPRRRPCPRAGHRVRARPLNDRSSWPYAGVAILARVTSSPAGCAPSREAPTPVMSRSTMSACMVAVPS